ncbi:type II secretion system F family protein [Patescibacteria group bacterium]|nr:type II secretion system F family protein [Patescibacteria group bacterium]
MPTFKYIAKRKDGEQYEDTIEATDRFSVYNEVRKEGNTIISVTEAKGSSIFKAKLSSINNIFSTVKTTEKISFAKNLSAMIKAGLALSRALDVIERQTHNKTFQKVVTGLNNDIKKGKALHQAMEAHPKVFSKLFVSMTKAGEESGGLAEALLTIASQVERAYTLRRKVRSALIYPTIIIIAMVGIGILMLIYVVPTLVETFEELGAELPKSTQAIISISNFITNNTVIFLIFLVGTIVAVWFGIRTKRGKRALDYTVLHIPIISVIVKEVNAARTSRALSSLLSSGVDVITAISITSEVVQNSYYKAVLTSAIARVQKGDPLSDVFKENENIYPILVGEMMAVGEETGQLSVMLEDIAEFYEGEVSQKTSDLSTVIEPFLMIFIGIVVGFFAVSMIAPIYSISESI